MRAKLMPAAAFVVAAAAVTGAAAARERSRCGSCSGTPAIDLYHSASVRVSGITARSAQVRPRRGERPSRAGVRVEALSLAGAPRPAAAPGTACCPPRRSSASTACSSASAEGPLVASLAAARAPRGTMARRAFPTAARRRPRLRGPSPRPPDPGRREAWPLADYDHRDPRLNRLFVIAYAPRGDSRPSSRLGLFVSTVRNGYHGRWRVLEATTQPYG